MNKLEKNLIYFLSDPSISENDLMKLLNWLESGGIKEVESKVNQIRNITKTKANYKPEDKYLDKIENVYPHKNNQIEEIERLLIKEANLPKKEAMKLLANYFDISYSPNSHIGFNKWIKNLVKEISWSEILHASHSIRNKKVHGEEANPWPFKETK